MEVIWLVLNLFWSQPWISNIWLPRQTSSPDPNRFTSPPTRQRSAWLLTSFTLVQRFQEAVTSHIPCSNATVRVLWKNKCLRVSKASAFLLWLSLSPLILLLLLLFQDIPDVGQPGSAACGCSWAGDEVVQQHCWLHHSCAPFPLSDLQRLHRQYGFKMDFPVSWISVVAAVLI